MKGTIKWFNEIKGYGFIISNDLDDIFVHYSTIVKDGFKTLGEGAHVEFKLVETPKGLQAIDVKEVEAKEDEKIGV